MSLGQKTFKIKYKRKTNTFKEERHLKSKNKQTKQTHKTAINTTYMIKNRKW